jgi:small ligand-binding sensory domain FIST
MPDNDPFRVAHAAGDSWQAAIDSCLADLGGVGAANLGFVYVADRFGGDFPAIVERLKGRTGIDTWIGATGIGICAGDREYFDQPATALLVGRLPPDSFRPFDTTAESLQSIAAAAPGAAGSRFAIVHCDPRNGRLFEQIPMLAAAIEGFVVGGLVSSRGGHGQAAGRATEGGLSGLLLSGDVAVATALSQGCTPIGPQHTVTAAEGNVAIEIDGRPALEVFKQDIGEILARDLKRCAGYIFAALPIAGDDRGDYLVRNLMGIDAARGLIAIGDRLAAGQRIMFCRRDRASAVEDLKRMTGELKRRVNAPPRAAIYFSCLARGPNMFGPDSAELALIQQQIGPLPLIGFFCNGEISNARLYTYTGVLALFL